MSGPQNSRLTSDSLLRAYMMGVFPMAEDVESNELFWVDPDYRGILPLDKLYVSRSLRKTIRKQKFTVTFDKSFKEVMENCRAKRDNRETSWINDEILTLYCDLHERGHAHSIECWQDDKLVGGLYGVSLGAAFLAKACSASPQMPAKQPSSILSPDCWLVVMCCLIRNSSQTICNLWAR